MKKTLVLLIAFAIVGGAFLFADDGVEITNPTKQLNVFGYIPVLEKTAKLNVTEALSVDDPINLRDNGDVQIGADGVEVGTWTVVTTNNTGDENYTLKYSYGKLSSFTVSTTLEYEILEYEVGETDYVVKAAESTTTFDGNSDNADILRILKVRLTDDPADADPAEDYSSTISLNLTAN
jgi:hypothetical protein